jgi:MSHA biogenesis protein MshI
MMFGIGRIRRKPGWLAILPQGKRIVLAHVVRRPGARPELCRLESFAVETTPVDALRRLRSARSFKSYACTTLMPAGQCSFVQIEAPTVAREERKEALRWALKTSVDFPLEGACIDALDNPVQSAGGPATVFAAASAEERVRACAETFERAGVALEAIGVDEIAQRNVAALLEDQDRGLVLLRIDETGGLLTLTYRGGLIAVRRIDVSTTQLIGSDAERRAQMLERLVLELQRSLDSFDRQFNSIPISKLVLAACPEVPGLLATLAENVYVPVQELDLATRIDFHAVPELRDKQQQGRALLAIGAALHAEGDGEGDEASAEVNLYEAHLHPRRELVTSRNLAVVCLVLLVAILALSGGAHYLAAEKVQAAALSRKQLTDAKEKLASLAAPGVQRSVAPALAAELEATKADVAARQELVSVLDGAQARSHPGFSAFMSGFARQAQSDLWLTGFTIGAGGEEIEIRGRLLEPARLPAYVQSLSSEPVFQGRRFATLEMRGIEPAETKAHMPPGANAAAPVLAPSRFVEFVLRSESAGGADAASGGKR